MRRKRSFRDEYRRKPRQAVSAKQYPATEAATAYCGPGAQGCMGGRNSGVRVPLRRLVRPDEIAAACAFLASADASGITGIDLTVDCGLTANWYILESIPADG